MPTARQNSKFYTHIICHISIINSHNLSHLYKLIICQTIYVNCNSPNGVQHKSRRSSRVPSRPPVFKFSKISRFASVTPSKTIRCLPRLAFDEVGPAGSSTGWYSSKLFMLSSSWSMRHLFKYLEDKDKYLLYLLPYQENFSRYLKAPVATTRGNFTNLWQYCRVVFINSGGFKNCEHLCIQEGRISARLMIGGSLEIKTLFPLWMHLAVLINLI